MNKISLGIVCFLSAILSCALMVSSCSKGEPVAEPEEVVDDDPNDEETVEVSQIMESYTGGWYVFNIIDKKARTAEAVRAPSINHPVSSREYTVPSYIKFEGRKYTVISLADNIFSWYWECELIKLPSKLEHIGRKAFYHCIQLPKIELPATVTSIGDSAFNRCDYLSEITSLNPVPPTLGKDVFSPTSFGTIKVLRVPSSAVDTYKAAEVWKDMNIVGLTIPESD